MKRLVLGVPPRNPEAFMQWAYAALSQIEQASFEDIEILFDDFTITGGFTPTRTLDASSASHDDLRAFIATLITDLTNRGQHRNYD
jgi:hypothetical protein